MDVTLFSFRLFSAFLTLSFRASNTRPYKIEKFNLKEYVDFKNIDVLYELRVRINRYSYFIIGRYIFSHKNFNYLYFEPKFPIVYCDTIYLIKLLQNNSFERIY